LIGCLDDADTFAVVTTHRKFGDAGEPANVGKRVVESDFGGHLGSALHSPGRFYWFRE
jgi:hypothetical protein